MHLDGHLGLHRHRQRNYTTSPDTDGWSWPGSSATPPRRAGQWGLGRTSFYEWKRRFQTQGFEGLKDLPPIHRSHPQTTPSEVVERIKALALEHPAYGCNRLEAMLSLAARLSDHHPEDPEASQRRKGHRDHRGTGGVSRRRSGRRTGQRHRRQCSRGTCCAISTGCSPRTSTLEKAKS
jgi:hypothetical protein